MSTQPLHTSTPRVNLPALPDSTPAPVLSALAKYADLYRQRTAHGMTVDRAKRELHAARDRDDAALAAALVDGTAEPKGRPATVKAEAALADAEARAAALTTAVATVHSQLSQAVTEHADEWAETLRSEHAAAADRYSAAAAELSAAWGQLSATGELLGMLVDGNPALLSGGTYRPNARLSVAAEAVSEARADVLTRLGALTPAEVDADDDAVAV